MKASAGLLAAVVILAAPTCWFLTGIVRRYALARAILDIPNHRSSHSVPTPRGGGVAIVTTFLASVLVLALAGTIAPSTAIGIGGGAFAIAAIGWLDDRRGVRAAVRMLVQVLAAAWTLYWLGGLPSIRIGEHHLTLGVAGAAVALVAIVWCTNLFNFMDGIDGIAAGQGTTAGLFGAVLIGASTGSGLLAIPALVAACCIGFLPWNWSPAKIFMGDVGSSTIGFVLAVIAIASENEGAAPIAAMILLGAPFLLDATVTLVRRFARGETLHEAHRSHAYQRAVQAGHPHAAVSGTVIAANVVLGVALVATNAHPGTQLLVVTAGFLLLSALYVWVEMQRPMPARTVSPS